MKKQRRSHERGRRRRGHGTLVAVLPGLPAGRATAGRPPPAQSVTEGGSPGFHGSRLSSVGFSFRHEQSVNHPAAVGVTRAAFSWRDSEGAPQPRGQGGRGRGPAWAHRGAGAPVPGTRSLPAPAPRRGLGSAPLRSARPACPPSPPVRAHVLSRADRHGPDRPPRPRPPVPRHLPPGGPGLSSPCYPQHRKHSRGQGTGKRQPKGWMRGRMMGRGLRRSGRLRTGQLLATRKGGDAARRGRSPRPPPTAAGPASCSNIPACAPAQEGGLGSAVFPFLPMGDRASGPWSSCHRFCH